MFGNPLGLPILCHRFKNIQKVVERTLKNTSPKHIFTSPALVFPLYKKNPSPFGNGSFVLCGPLGLHTEEAHDTERLLDKATSRSIGVQLVETSRTRDSTDEADRCRNDLLNDGVRVDALNDEVENIGASEGAIELRHIDEGSLGPGLLDELVDGVTVLVDLREVLGARQRNAELERVLAGVEVALALGLRGRHDDRKVADDLVEVLVLPEGGRGAVNVNRRNLDIVGEVGVVQETVGLVLTEVVAEERNRVLVQLETKGESGTVGLVSRSLLTDGCHTLLLEFTRKDALREANDGALFVVPVVASKRRLSMVAIRTRHASKFADTEDHAFLEPLADRGTTKEFVSLASLGHDRDETVHPVLQELNRHLVRGGRHTRSGHSVHDHLEVDVFIHTDTHAVKSLGCANQTLSGVERKTFLDFLLREVVEVLSNRLRHC